MVNPLECRTEQCLVRLKKWETRCNELAKQLYSLDLPKKIQLSRSEHITNVPGFIRSHLKYVKSNPYNRSVYPYISRLKQLKTILEQ